MRAGVKENRGGLKRRDGSHREPVGPDWAVAVGGMWAISIPLMSSVKRQELSKWMSVCVCMCVCVCLSFVCQLSAHLSAVCRSNAGGGKQLLHTYQPQ